MSSITPPTVLLMGAFCQLLSTRLLLYLYFRYPHVPGIWSQEQVCDVWCGTIVRSGV
jgi:hypothetical protein